MTRVRTLVLGGGLAGIGAAMRLGKDFLLVEKEPTLGGLARSKQVEGFTCDLTGHLLHCRTAEGRRLIEECLGDNLVWFQRRSAIWFEGRFVRYPFQAYLCDLPEAVREECLQGFRAAKGGAARSFEEWIRTRFGEGIARHFMLPYNRKVWAVPLAMLDADWTEGRVPVPTLAEVEQGAQGKLAKEFGYNVTVGYPKVGGIQALTDGLLARIDMGRVRTGTSVAAIDPQARRARLSTGEEVEYERCISTIPLAALADVTRGASAAGRVRANQVVCVSVASPAALPYHWIYTPGAEVPFYRVGCSSLFSPAVAPAGQHLLYVEFAFSPDVEPSVPEAPMRTALSAIAGAPPESFRIVDQTVIRQAYPLFERGWKERVAVVRRWFASMGIATAGRFGRWAYHSMEDALLDGAAAADAR